MTEEELLGPVIQAAAAQDAQSLDKPGDFSGLFGIRGTGRDILGTIGDALLIQSGNDAIFRPQIANENRADALRNFGNDPQEAIRRMQQFDPEMAQEMQQNFTENQIAAAEEARAVQAAAEETAGINLDRTEQVRGLAGQILSEARGNPTLFETARAQAQALADSAGIELNIPQSAEGLDAFLRSSIPVSDQFEFDVDREGLAIRQQNADTGVTNAETNATNADSLGGRRGVQNAADAAGAATDAVRARTGEFSRRDRAAGRGRGNGRGRPGGGSSASGAAPQDGDTAGNGSHIYRPGRGWITREQDGQ